MSGSVRDSAEMPGLLDAVVKSNGGERSGKRQDERILSGVNQGD
jgi:hypothetical protein